MFYHNFFAEADCVSEEVGSIHLSIQEPLKKSMQNQYSEEGSALSSV